MRPFTLQTAITYRLLQMKRHVQLSVSTILFLATASCGLVLYRAWLEAPSANGEALLTIWEKCPNSDCVDKITLTFGGKDRQLPSGNSDRYLTFVDVAWFDSGSKVAVFGCDGIGGNMLLGYDLRSDRVAPISEVRESVRQSLVKRYALSIEALEPFKGDPLAWACSDNGQKRFGADHLTRQPRVLEPLS